MATRTPNYDLIKPSYTESVDVAVINKNMDSLDTILDNKMNKPLNNGAIDQILRHDGNGHAVWGNPATGTEVAEAVTEWLDENIIDTQGVALDDSLTVQHAAADAKAAGNVVVASTTQPNIPANKLWIKDSSEAEYTVPTYDEFSDLKSALMAHKRLIGFYPLAGANSAQINAFSLFIKTMIDNDPTVYEGLRIARVTNTQSYPKSVRVIFSDGTMKDTSFDSTSGLNKLTYNGSTLSILMDWDRYTSACQFNESTYANCNIQISEYGTVDDDIKAVENSLLPINRERSVTGFVVLDSAPVSQINATKLIYKTQITGNASIFESARLIILVNTQNYTKYVRLKLSAGDIFTLTYNSATKANEYTANDGTKIAVYVDWAHYDSDTMAVNLANYSDSFIELDLVSLSDSEGNVLGIGEIRVSPVSATEYEKSIADNNSQIKKGSSGAYNHISVKKYPVVSGKNYRIAGNGVYSNYSYPVCVFSTENYDGSTTVGYSSVIIAYSGSSDPVDYNALFTPASNGYIYVNLYDKGNQVYVFDAKTGSDLINKLTNSNETPIKIQLFGDSITDDSWRDDHTTWATLLPSYFPQRKLTIVNDAVGGSHIGHGKVSGSEAQGGKHSDLEYNYIYDLMTNNTVFQPDSDVFIMFTGANDFNSGQLGEWGDTTVDTFYGAARLICEYITQNTDALFMVCTPLCRYSATDRSRPTNEDGEPISSNTRPWTLRQFADAIIRTCEWYQIPVIDLFHDMGFNRNNIGNFTDEGLHPNFVGSHKIAQYIASKLREHIENYTYLQKF